jgi:hypothetical protein
MCDRGAGRSLASVSSIHPRPLLFLVSTPHPDASVHVWALVPADAPPEVVADVPRVMQIAYDAAWAEVTAFEEQR